MAKTASKQIPRQEMPTRSPEERRNCFDEVALGYTMGLAVAEANRCLQCKKSPCVAGCPVEVRIPEFIKARAPRGRHVARGGGVEGYQ